jgi:hypothetical protein
MATRSISDEEIGLIKTMLDREMKNRDIQFYFNRPDRPVNSGRITQIRQGTYGANVAKAPAAALDAFLASQKPTQQAPASPAQPLQRRDELAAMFEQATSGWRLVGGETERIECKREIDVKKLTPIVRAIAAMANNCGGTILLGVEDKSSRVVGLTDDSFAKMDLVKLTNAVKAHLQPTPTFSKGVFDIGGSEIGFVDVEVHQDKPVIVYRQGDRLEDGAILFRYPAESANIKFGDLRTLLDDRDARRLQALAIATRRIAEIGPENAAVLSTLDGSVSVGDRPLVVDKDLLDRVTLIREGHFDEINGGPALKILGEITSTEAASASASGRRVITDEDVLRNFLDQEVVFAPIEYLRFAATATNRDWLPIFYFAGQAGLTGGELSGLIGTFETPKTKHRAEMVERAQGSRSAYAKPTGSPAACLKTILSGAYSPPADVKAAEHVAMALRGLPQHGAPQQTSMLTLLKNALDVLVKAERWTAMSHVYRAAARLDEIYFNTSA